jgi:hypothetical protein
MFREGMRTTAKMRSRAKAAVASFDRLQCVREHLMDTEGVEADQPRGAVSWRIKHSCSRVRHSSFLSFGSPCISLDLPAEGT